MDRYQLAQVFSPSQGPVWRLRQGQAVSVQADYTATIKIAGSDTEVDGVRYIGSPPTPGAGVWVMASSTDLLIIGTSAAAGRALAPRVYRTTDQSINNASATPLLWEGEDSDAYGFFSPSASQTMLVSVPGRYIAVGQVDFASNGTGVRSASLLVDGAVVGAQRIGAYTGVAHVNVQSVPFSVASSASVELWVEQDAGGPLNVVASGSVSPGLGIYYLGP